MPTTVTIFSDFVDPFAYVAETALRELGVEREIVIAYRALELHPAPDPLPDAAHLAGRVREAEPVARNAGLALRPPTLVPRTRKCHEAARYAAEHDAEGPLRQAMYRAYWESGLDIGRIDVLATLAEEVGLDGVGLRIALDIDSHGDAVRRDAVIARRLGVTIVPTIYVGTGPAARILVGPQDPAALDAALGPR